MNIGDKVRVIHGKEEGRVIRFIGSNQVEIEIADGFIIPVLRNELVVIAQQEKKDFSSDESQASKSKNEGGIYMAFVPFNDKILNLTIINDTAYQVFFNLYEETDKNTKGLYAAALPSGKAISATDLNIHHFEQWPVFHLQVIFFKHGIHPIKEPLYKKVKLKAASFFKSKQTAPILEQQAYLVRLDMEAIKIDAKELSESILKNSTSISNETPISKPSREIDLHIEKLSDQYEGMSNSQKLQLQLSTFQKNLDNAIATGMNDIIFIHGVGNGVLKNEIHKLLSKNTQIKFFQDAQKEKFGYGATMVGLK